LAAGVLVIGLLVTGALTWVSSRQYTRNESRLLNLRAREVGAVLTATLPSIQTPLASAAALADATSGDAAKFTRFIAQYVGRETGRPFVSASLWRVSDPARGPVALVGAPPVLAAGSERTRAFFRRASTASHLSVTGMLGGSRPRLGYGFSGAMTGPFVAYAESQLPADRYQPVQNSSAFSDLDYALYLGQSAKPEDLLIASERRLPLRGRHDTASVPFGDTFFTVTVAARRPLGGSLPQRLPWAIAVVGLLLSLGAAVVTARLIERRRAAEDLAERLDEIAQENRRLYAEQRGIAQTLQHALLPEALPQVPGVEVSACFEAGTQGIEIGGDWYDLIALERRRLLLVVGDVSGRGLRAAATMASLRFGIQAYAAQGDSPATLLSKLSELINLEANGQLATVLCALVDIDARQVSVTSAGHLPPLLIADGTSRFVESRVGPPVGVARHASYPSTTVSAPAGATLLAFTDGLVERRGESIDAGLERLRARADANHATLDELLTRVLGELRDGGAEDDSALAGIRWMS
jgi:hypothetical protein